MVVEAHWTMPVRMIVPVLALSASVPVRFSMPEAVWRALEDDHLHLIRANHAVVGEDECDNPGLR